MSGSRLDLRVWLCILRNQSPNELLYALKRRSSTENFQRSLDFLTELIYDTGSNSYPLRDQKESILMS